MCNTVCTVGDCKTPVLYITLARDVVLLIVLLTVFLRGEGASDRVDQVVGELVEGHRER